MTIFVPVPSPAAVTCQTCWVLVNWDDKERHAAWHSAGLVVESPGDQAVETIAELERRGL